MGRPELSTTTDANLEDRRERLIQTAIALFSERSYDAVSVQDIAARANVATGLIYYHFTDKQGLFAAGMEALAERLRQRVRAATNDPSCSSPMDRLLAGLKAQLEFLQEHPTLYHELNGNASQPKVKAIVDRDRSERMQLAGEALSAEVRATPAVSATLEGWVHFVEGVEIAWVQEPKLTAEQICELCCRVLLATVRAAADFEREQPRA
jgi:AcrR family transcriptional regulator